MEMFDYAKLSYIWDAYASLVLCYAMRLSTPCGTQASVCGSGYTPTILESGDRSKECELRVPARTPCVYAAVRTQV